MSLLVRFAPYTSCTSLYAFNHSRTVIIFTSSVLRCWDLILLAFLSENICPLDWVRGIQGCPIGVSTGIEPFGVTTICKSKIFKGPRTRTDSLEQNLRKKADIRFGTRNVRGLYRAASFTTVTGIVCTGCMWLRTTLSGGVLLLR